MPPATPLVRRAQTFTHAIYGIMTGTKRTRKNYDLGEPGTRILNLLDRFKSTPNLWELYVEGYRFACTLDGKYVPDAVVCNEPEGYVEAYELSALDAPEALAEASYSGAIPRRRFQGEARLVILWDNFDPQALDHLVQALDASAHAMLS
jgi:hypothetical protein